MIENNSHFAATMKKLQQRKTIVMLSVIGPEKVSETMLSACSQETLSLDLTILTYVCECYLLAVLCTSAVDTQSLLSFHSCSAIPSRQFAAVIPIRQTYLITICIIMTTNTS